MDDQKTIQDKNSQEVLIKIASIPNLDKEVHEEFIRQRYEQNANFVVQSILKSKYGIDCERPVDGDVSDENIQKLVDEISNEEKMQATKALVAGGRGNCRALWGVKKSILKQKYGIDWITPDEGNMHIQFD